MIRISLGYGPNAAPAVIFATNPTHAVSSKVQGEVNFKESVDRRGRQSLAYITAMIASPTNGWIDRSFARSA